MEYAEEVLLPFLHFTNIAVEVTVHPCHLVDDEKYFSIRELKVSIVSGGLAFLIRAASRNQKVL